MDMIQRRYKANVDETGAPLVQQPAVHGFQVSFNPDDELFYVHCEDADATTRGRFREFRNVVQFCRLARQRIDAQADER